MLDVYILWMYTLGACESDGVVVGGLTVKYKLEEIARTNKCFLHIMQTRALGCKERHSTCTHH